VPTRTSECNQSALTPTIMYFEFCFGWEWGEWGRTERLPPGRWVVVVVAVVRVYGKETVGRERMSTCAPVHNVCNCSERRLNCCIGWPIVSPLVLVTSVNLICWNSARRTSASWMKYFHRSSKHSNDDETVYLCFIKCHQVPALKKKRTDVWTGRHFGSLQAWWWPG